MAIGLGTGSTIELAIEELGRRVQAGLALTAVPSSRRTEERAREHGIIVGDLAAVSRLDLAIDSADEVDPQYNLIKGGGGALVRERIVISSAETVVIVVDSSKLVAQLGAFPLPVEVVPFAWRQVARHLGTIDRPAMLRGGTDQPFVTDNGNYILDCLPQPIAEPLPLYQYLRSIPGVVDAGIFCNEVDILVVGFDDHADVRQAPEAGENRRFTYT